MGLTITSSEFMRSWSMCFMHRSSWRKNVFAKQKIEAGEIDCADV